MKFDYILGNPPYQVPIGNGNKTKTIWDSLVVKCYELLKVNGQMSLIHPGGWRFATNGSTNDLKSVLNIYKTNKIVSMELNDAKQGIKTFGVQSDYDVITLIKTAPDNNTKVTTKLDGIININMSKFSVIPTDNILLFQKLKCKKAEEKVNLMYSSSAYEARMKNTKKWMSQIENNEFKYPVIYTITGIGGVNLWYSNTKNKGHFGVSKLILKKAAKITLLDLEGKYGMTQYAAGIIDTAENLVKIQKVFECEIFTAFQMSVTGAFNNTPVDGLGTMFKFIKEFRKDWWKELYTPEMELELISEGVLDSKGNYIG